jgi:predicted ATP-grasp superfamily ATP-dependent carboligase
VKAWRADSHEQLRELFKRAAAQVEAGEIMIQDLIPGGGEQQFAFCAFFAEGRSFGSMVVRRSRQHPRQFGKASTYVETIDVPILQELSERFLRQIDYYGLVELEYKLDPRDNQFKLLDVNARAWGYHTLGGVAGVDFPYLLFCDQTGNAVRLCKGRTGARWIRLVTDVPTGLMGMWSRQQAAWSYLKSLVSFDVESVFCLDDPLPGIAELGLMPYSHLRRALTR